MAPSSDASESNKPRTERINIRARDEQCALIDRAATLLHKTRSEFMLEAACNKAEDVLLDKQNFFLNESQWENFWAVLDAPARPNFKLQQLLKTSDPWEA